MMESRGTVIGSATLSSCLLLGACAALPAASPQEATERVDGRHRHFKLWSSPTENGPPKQQVEDYFDRLLDPLLAACKREDGSSEVLTRTLQISHGLQKRAYKVPARLTCRPPTGTGQPWTTHLSYDVSTFRDPRSLDTNVVAKVAARYFGAEEVARRDADAAARKSAEQADEEGRRAAAVERRRMADAQEAARRMRIPEFRNNVRAGDWARFKVNVFTQRGLVVEVKGPLALLQAADGTTRWVPIDQLEPAE